MPTFLSTCNCRGYRPEGVVSSRHYARPDLIAKLLKERRVSRFIVAPAGFGKTSLAFEYADVVFSFQHVFWINCRSPCFLRDLDDAVLLPDLFASDDSPRLVVCEDVPLLDMNRASVFTQFIDTLLDQNIEVLVTCVPSADSFDHFQRDRVYLDGSDLLLSDDEMLAEEMGGRIRKGWDAPNSHVSRIACLRWSEDGIKEILNGLRDEEVSGDMRLAMFALLVLGAGSVDDLRMFLPQDRIDEILAILERDYLLFGVKLRMRSFRAIDVDISALSEIFCTRVDNLVAPSLYPDRDKLCRHFSDALLARYEPSKACAFMREFGAKADGATWLADKGWEILAQDAPLALFELYNTVRRSVGEARDAVNVQRAWAGFMLDDLSLALSIARRTVQSKSISEIDMLSSLILLIYKDDTKLHDQPLELFQRMTDGGYVFDLEQNDKQNTFQVIDWLCVAHVLAALNEGVEDALKVWVKIFEESREINEGDVEDQAYYRNTLSALLLSAAWIFDAIIAFCEGDLLSENAESAQEQFTVFLQRGVVSDNLKTVLNFVVQQLDREASAARLSWFAHCAGDSFECLVDLFPHFCTQRLTKQSTTAVHRVRLLLLDQKDGYRKQRNSRNEKIRAFRSTNPDDFRADVPLETNGLLSKVGIPILHVTLFGSDEIRIGDKLIDHKTLSRRKARVFLALLVLNHGREISKDRLAGVLWPESKIEVARKNLLSAWSQLRRALNLNDDRGCPYLIRTRSGCRVDMRFIASDVYLFEDLCRSLLFGAVGGESWERLYAQVCEDFAEDLLPGEADNEIIVSLRQRYHMQLIDALIAASTRLRSQGEPRGSLWFAREALRRDSTREDVYVALMEAQIASNQRSAALETYFSCRRFLSDELGIDPSARVVELYRSVIETEESLL